MLMGSDATAAKTVGIVMNARAGKDIRRLAAHGPVPSDMSRIADLQRIIVGARSAGAVSIVLPVDGRGLAERAVEGQPDDVELLDIAANGTGDDSATAASTMRELGVGAIVVAGGDGTHRDVARGWRDAPIVALASGTNNAYPQQVEASIAGAAAGLAVTIEAPFDELVAYQSLVIDLDVEGEVHDIALISAAVLRDDLGAASSLWQIDHVDQVLATVAEPWSIGLSAFAGIVAPTSRTDDRGVLLDLDPKSPRRITAPIAPGKYVEAGLSSASVVELEQPVAVRGPARFALDGERAAILADDEWAAMTMRRDGPRVIDIRRTFSIAVRQGRFYADPTAD